MNHKKFKHILILGGSSDIGIEVVKNFLHLGWQVTAHFNKNYNDYSLLELIEGRGEVPYNDVVNYVSGLCRKKAGLN